MWTMPRKRDFNLIGFNFSPDITRWRHCSIHEGTRLIKDAKDPDLLLCPECGLSYQTRDTQIDQTIQSKFKPQGQTSIIQGKPKKKYVSEAGDVIPADDFDAIADLASGKKIVYYREDKVESAR